MKLTLEIVDFKTTIPEYVYQKYVITPMTSSDWVLDGKDKSLPYGVKYPIDIAPIRDNNIKNFYIDLIIENKQNCNRIQYQVYALSNEYTLMNSNKLLTEFDHDFSIMIQYMGRYVIDLLFNLGYFIYEK